MATRDLGFWAIFGAQKRRAQKPSAKKPPPCARPELPTSPATLHLGPAGIGASSPKAESRQGIRAQNANQLYSQQSTLQLTFNSSPRTEVTSVRGLARNSGAHVSPARLARNRTKLGPPRSSFVRFPPVSRASARALVQSAGGQWNLPGILVQFSHFPGFGPEFPDCQKLRLGNFGPNPGKWEN